MKEDTIMLFKPAVMLLHTV